MKKMQFVKQVIILCLSLLTMGVYAQDHTFTFTSQPRNSDFRFASKAFLVEGKLIAENQHTEGKDLFYAIQRAEYDDILISYVSLNSKGEAVKVLFVYINKEQSQDLEFSVLTDHEKLDVSINYDPFLSETIEQDVADKVQGELNGILISKFKSKKDLENFKKFLKRN
jgi:hypothetical protein